jgi:hypothetical protein
VFEETPLVDKVLHSLHRKGLLPYFMVVGSWTLYFYEHKFGEYLTMLPWRTLDIEFDISSLNSSKRCVDIPALFDKLDFLIRFHGEGYISFDHLRLRVEFLVPEKGKGATGPHKCPGFGINAQPLRFLSLLEDNPITIEYQGLPVRVSRPANFAIHKLIISDRRVKGEKAQKDREQALAVWDMLVRMREDDTLAEVYSQIPAAWQKKLRKVLGEMKESHRIDKFEV